ncbi:MAG TPA: hypothetical protein ACFYD4_16535, partial [Candidatus Wunengus sp. YC61]|uniref:hypothetical protein n=1 Tax=Candidatus Wunengus sp. YC61 TaxID=3367698 RepID=UPI00402911DE
ALGYLHIDSFKKTDGQKQLVSGVEMYILSYEVVYSFPKGTQSPCAWWSSTGILVQCEGQSVKDDGRIIFEKTEKGWSVSGVDNYRGAGS